MKRLDVEWGGTQGACLKETLEDLDRIVRMDEPVLRNLWITQRYHTLSAGLSEVVCANNVNWSTFATWASKTAGQSIRNEEVPRFLLEAWELKKRFDATLSQPARKVLAFIGLINAFEDAAVRTVRDVSHQVAEGNKKVFQELAPIFARFIDVMRSSKSEESVEAFVLALEEGPVERGGQDLLRAAFRNYFRASESSDHKRRAEYVLLANCQIGLHEQTRLQPNIQAAMDAPIATLFSRNLRASLPSLLLRPVAVVMELLAKPLVIQLQRLWEETATRHAMNLALPQGKEIPLGRDFPERPSDYPEALLELELPELVALLTRFDGRLDSMIDSGANNWSDLEDRMGFIVELFRYRQQEAALLGPPFSEVQLAALSAGRLPDGAL